MNLVKIITNKISEYIPSIYKSKVEHSIIHETQKKKQEENGQQKKDQKGRNISKSIQSNNVRVKRITQKKVQNRLPKKSTKQSIPKTIRNQVWRRFCGNHLDAKCFCCDQHLAYESWEAGHVISDAKGGKTVVENLRPICLPCNRSMGTKHMYEFMKEYQLAGLKNIK